jgi:4-methyl-5(b-hydroxyethyl)-thiazole monophosphate biosynthesis
MNIKDVSNARHPFSISSKAAEETMVEHHSTVLVFIASGVEEMEAVTVCDILRRGGLNVILAGESEIITASRGMKFLPDVTFEHIADDEEYLAIVLPGGSRAADTFSNHPHIERILRAHVKRNSIIGAMCASPSVLVAYDLLPQGTPMTSHKGVKHVIEPRYEYIDEKIVINENVITCQGAGCSIDFALNLLSMLAGEDMSRHIAKEIVY